MKLTFLSGSRPLTKTIVLNADGSYDQIPYPLISDCTSHVENVSTIEEFHQVLLSHAKSGHALLKGNLQRPINMESRAGLTKAETTSWLVVDFDGMDQGSSSIAELLVEIGFGNVDHIVQYSASHGIKAGLSAHVFILLDKPIAPETLKQYLKAKNLTVPLLKNQLELTKSGMSLHYPMDISVADLSRLIYIGLPTILNGPDPVQNRIELVKGAKRYTTLGDIVPVQDSAVTDIILALRAKAGLPERKFSTKQYRAENLEVLANPDKLSITGEKEDGDFVRLNVNGSLSWGYYILKNNPEVLMNFRGETPVLLKEAAPEFYKNAKAKVKELKREAHVPKELNGHVQRWVINNKAEGKYCKVEYIPGQGITLYPAPTFKHISDWCMTHKLPIPEIVEDWSVTFDPTSTKNIDPETRTINTYSPTIYRVKAEKNGEAVPTEYRNLINWICGCDEESTNHFINWLAYIWQTGKRPKTAFIFATTYGTGKGRFLNVLKALFGQHCVAVGPEALADTFNEHLKTAQIVWLDEVTTDSWDNDRMTPKLRALIDGEVPLRAMRKGWENMEPYFGLCIAGNEHNIIEVKTADRRYNVVPRQQTKLEFAPWVHDEYELFDDDDGFIYQPENLQKFANALMSWQVDRVKVRRPMVNEAKDAVMRVTQSLPDDIVQALLAGNVGFFLQYLPGQEVIPTMEGAEYTRIVGKMVHGGKVPIFTRDLYKLFEFLAGWNQKIGKFTKAVSKYGLDLSGKVAREGTVVQAGTYFEFHPTEEDKAVWAQQNKKLEVVREARTQN